jgi:hypothetical protein
MATDTMVYMGCTHARRDKAKRTGLTCLPTKLVLWLRDCSSRRKLVKNTDMAWLVEKGRDGRRKRFWRGAGATMGTTNAGRAKRR